jgi:hypothetical protein
MMFPKAWSIGAIILCVTLGPAGAECDLSGLLEASRVSLAKAQPSTILSIKRGRIAIVAPLNEVPQVSETGLTPLLELRGDIAVEVGTVELAEANFLSMSFQERFFDTETELVIGSDHAVLLGNEDCNGADWQARPLSTEFYFLDETESETRFTVGQIYDAVMAGIDLRDALMPTISLDLRRKDRLSETLTELSPIQSSVIIRPIMGRLSTAEVHIPTFALRAPSEFWLSDEIRHLSRIEDADWQLGRATLEANLTYSNDDIVAAGFYLPLSDRWSAEFYSKSLNDRAFYAALQGEGVGLAVAAGRDLGRSQVGALFGAEQNGLRAAALFERSFGLETEAWAFLETHKTDWGFVIGASHRLPSEAEFDIALSRIGAEGGPQLAVGFSLALSGSRPARLSLEIGDRAQDLRTLRRNAATIRSGRRQVVDAKWPVVLD